MAERDPVQCFGAYRILGLIGRGGMGSVYLAEQTGPGGFRREVVLKLIRIQEDLGDEYRRMLLDEAQLTAWIDHPNVVKVFEVGEQQERLYIALERIVGINLLTLTQRLRPRQLPIALAAALMAQACDGLHAAHELVHGGVPLQVIHRDVSLSNLMLDRRGWIRVIDFGIARPDARHARHALTSPEMVRGNPAYMAPEQIMAGELDRTVDVYSAALIFYELCIGKHPFDRSLRRTTLAPLRGVCGEVGPVLNEVVNASLALEPCARPAQISTLGAALWDFANRHGYGDRAYCLEFFRAAGVSLGPDALRPAELLVDLVQPHGPTQVAGDAGLHRRPAIVPNTRPPLPSRPPAPPSAKPPRKPTPETVRAAAASEPLPTRAAAASGPLPDSAVSEPEPRTAPVPGLPRVVVVPEPAAPLLLADGAQAIVYTTQIRVDERGPHSLALSRVPELAPLPLSFSYIGDTLCVHCAANSGSGERIALYVDAQQPDARLERLLIGPGSPPQSFDVGHRRLAVRRLLCTVGRLEGERWSVRLHKLSLELEAPPECALLVVLVAREEARADRPPIYHLECICIRSARR